MNDLVGAIGEADSVWSVAAIAIVGLYVLVWKFGGQLLSLAKENKEAIGAAKQTAAEAKVAATSVANSITTNHGSKNIGDAVDKITVALGVMAEESKSQLAMIHAVNLKLDEHIEKTNGGGH